MSETFTVRGWISYLAVVSALGCGADTPAGACDEEAGVGDVELSARDELQIPIGVRDSHSMVLLLDELVQHQDGSKTMIISHSLALALGEGYPAALEVTLANVWDTTCGQVSGTFDISEVITNSAMLTAEQTGAQGLALGPREEGNAAVMVRGTFTVAIRGCQDRYDGGEVVGFELSLAVAVRRPAGAAFTVPMSCRGTSPFYIESGAPASGFAVTAIDSSGAAFYPANVTPERPVTVTVTAPGATVAVASLEAGLGSLVVSGPDGVVRLASDSGDALELALIGAERVNAMDVTFRLLGAGGGGVDLIDGETYGEDGFGRTSDQIAPTVTALYVDAVPVCTLPRPDAFTLTGTTPSTCLVEDPAPESTLHGDPVGAGYVNEAALVTASGVCRLRVTAPGLDGCRGLKEELSVTILNTDSLISIGR